MFQKVLVPLDGSELAEGILPYVSQLARGLNIPVLVMSVVSPDTLEALSQESEKVKLKTENYLQEVAKRLVKEGAQAESMFSFGRPAERIVQVAERQGCNLIAMSTHSENHLGRGVLGSVTDKVIHSSHIPTLTIHPQEAKKYREQEVNISKVIVPLDGSSLAETALPYAEDLAQKLSLELTLVRVITVSGLYSASMAEAYIGSVDLEAAAEAGAIEYLEGITKKLRVEGLEVQAKPLRGVPAHSIVEQARNTPQSIVILTTHGRSALARWLMGSVTEAVLRTSEGPVLVIPHRYGRQYAVEITDMLERTPIFSELTERDLESIAQSARIRTYQPDDVIVREGDKTAGFFIISSGKVEVVKGVDTPNPSVLAALGPGEFFGEMAIIDDHPRSATVRALEGTECVMIRRSDFMVELQHHPEIAVRMLPPLVRRLREARDTPTE
jgi:nucleotide-binding universal stress UspA family protein